MWKILNQTKKYLIANHKAIYIRILIALLCYLIFMIIDRTTKGFIYTAQEYQNQSGKYISWGIIGFRPITNNGAAFSSFLGHYGFLQTVAMIMFLISISTTFIVKINMRFFVPIILIGAGALGNAIDRFIYNGFVRDMLYFPWWQSYATFNIADSFVVVDSIVLVIFIIMHLFQGTSVETTAKVA